MSRDDDESARTAAVRDRNTRERGGGNRRTHTRHNLEGDSRRRKRDGFLAPTAEDKGITPFESNDTLAPARAAKEEGVDERLISRGSARTLANEHALRALRECEHFRLN